MILKLLELLFMDNENLYEVEKELNKPLLKPNN